MSLVLRDRDRGVVVLTLNDPGRRNILSGALCRALSDAVAESNADADVRAIVVTGAAPAFCAGADLGDLDAASRGNASALGDVYRSFVDVAESPLPTIAAVNGAAVGAGLNLALACDYRIAADDALFDTRFLELGLHPGGGHAWLLIRAVGWAQASRMLLAGQSLRGAQAAAVGLVQDVTVAGAVLELALAQARVIAAAPRELVLRSKASMRLAAASDHPTSFAHETAEQAWSLGTPAFRTKLDHMRSRIRSS